MSKFNKYLESVQQQYSTLKVIKIKGGWEVLSDGQTQFYIYEKNGQYEILDDGGDKVSKAQEQKLMGHPLIIDKLGL